MRFILLFNCDLSCGGSHRTRVVLLPIRGGQVRNEMGWKFVHRTWVSVCLGLRRFDGVREFARSSVSNKGKELVMFDTLLYAKRLEASGMSREQAEAQVNVIAEMVVDGVATKQDLALQNMATQKEFAELRLEMHTEFTAVRSEMAEGFAAIRSEMADGLAAVRVEMNQGLASVRAEMSEGLTAVRAEMHAQTVRTGMMIAASTSLTVAILMYFR